MRFGPELGHHRQVNDADGDPRPIEQALELFVYAPLGFALEVRSLLPRFVERGRGQVALARLIGRYAVGQGSTAAGGLAAQVTDQAQGVLRLVGIGVPGGAGVPPAPRPGGRGGEPTATAAPASRPGRLGEGAAPPPVDPATLAIPDYDSLSASQVVPRLDGLTAVELEAVRTYEAATRSRKTILNKIAQLQSV